MLTRGGNCKSTLHLFQELFTLQLNVYVLIVSGKWLISTRNEWVIDLERSYLVSATPKNNPNEKKKQERKNKIKTKTKKQTKK